MIRMSGSRDGQALHAIVIVAFDRVSGRVHGVSVHGSHGIADRASVERSRERFLSELGGRLGGAELDAIELPFDQFERGTIERVDPQTRQPILKGELAPATPPAPLRHV
jgi:hypothetical protein